MVLVPEAPGVHLPPTTAEPRPDPRAAEIAEPTEQLAKRLGDTWVAPGEDTNWGEIMGKSWKIHANSL